MNAWCPGRSITCRGAVSTGPLPSLFLCLRRTWFETTQLLSSQGSTHKQREKPCEQRASATATPQVSCLKRRSIALVRFGASPLLTDDSSHRRPRRFPLVLHPCAVPLIAIRSCVMSAYSATRRVPDLIRLTLCRHRSFEPPAPLHLRLGRCATESLKKCARQAHRFCTAAAWFVIAPGAIGGGAIGGGGGQDRMLRRTAEVLPSHTWAAGIGSTSFPVLRRRFADTPV